jgi:hypothetical protein
MEDEMATPTTTTLEPISININNTPAAIMVHPKQ